MESNLEICKQDITYTFNLVQSIDDIWSSNGNMFYKFSRGKTFRQNFNSSALQQNSECLYGLVGFASSRHPFCCLS